MEQQNYQASILVPATPQQALEAIAHVADWWTKSFTGASRQMGDSFTVRFGETFVAFEVTAIEEGKMTEWLVTDCNLSMVKDKKEWKDTRVKWEIIPEAHSTRINMTHIGLVPDVECYAICEKGWDFFVKASLCRLLTEDQGMPDTPVVERQVPS